MYVQMYLPDSALVEFMLLSVGALLVAKLIVWLVDSIPGL